MDLPVSLKEAVLGGVVEIPTPSGPLRVTLPAHSDTGRRIRLRGKGVAAHGDRPPGDLLLTLRIVSRQSGCGAGGIPARLDAGGLLRSARRSGDTRSGDTGMITLDILCTRLTTLRIEDLRRWIAEGHVGADRQAGELLFEEIDVERVRLILDLRDMMQVNEEALPVVLSLLDQLYALRRQLGRLGVPEDDAGNM